MNDLSFQEIGHGGWLLKIQSKNNAVVGRCQYSENLSTQKDYVPFPLNAVVVKKRDNKTPSFEKQVAFVTNIDIKDPFINFARYDERSLMENKPT